MEYNIEDTYASEKEKDIYQQNIELMFKQEKKNRYNYSIYDLTSFLRPEVRNRRQYVGLSYLGELTRGLLKVLMFKRLESSVYSFCKSIERMTHQHDFMLRYLDRGLVVTGKLEKLQLFLDFGNDDIDETVITTYPIVDFDLKRLKKAIEDGRCFLHSNKECLV